MVNFIFTLDDIFILMSLIVIIICFLYIGFLWLKTTIEDEIVYRKRRKAVKEKEENENV